LWPASILIVIVRSPRRVNTVLLLVKVERSACSKLKVAGDHIFWQLKMVTCRLAYKVKQRINNVLWTGAPCHLVHSCRCFERLQCLHLQGQAETSTWRHTTLTGDRHPCRYQLTTFFLTPAVCGLGLWTTVSAYFVSHLRVAAPGIDPGLACHIVVSFLFCHSWFIFFLYIFCSLTFLSQCFANM
jgi:hypothetical protein